MASVAAGITVRSVLLKVGKAVGVYLAGKLLDKATDALSGSTRESVVRRIEGQKVNVRSTQAALPVVYGIQRVGLVVNDVRNAASPGTFFSGATGKDVLVKSGAIAIGSEDGSGIQAVDNIRVYDDGDYAITSPASFPSSAVNTNVATPYTNYLKYIIQDGDDAQTLPSDLGTAMGWSADYKARGVAYGAFFCLYNENVWKRGVPQITMDVTGNRVYDPRTSSWIGYNASGASSDNPALCILDYLTSKRYGAGIPYAARDGGTLDFIDEQSFEDAADYCDVLVSTYTAGPQEKRFRMNAVVDTSRVVSANLVEMLATCRGELVWQNGKYRLIIRQAQTAQSFELTEDNIVGSLDWTRQGTSVPNLIEATFPNGSGDDYVADSIQFPPVGTTTYLDEDNGIENRLEIALPYTTSIYQAQRTVETMLKELRADVYVTLTATQAAYTLQVGDVVNVTHSGPQWAQKPFVVRSVALTADGLVGLGLQEYDSTAYTLTTPDQESSDDAIDLPDPQRAFITVGMSGDRFVSQGATTSGGVAAQQWKRRLQFRTGVNTRSVNIVYDFDRPGLAGGAATNFSRNYVLNVTPDTEVTHILQDGASADQIFLARDDNGTTRYDEAISVTITPNDTTGGGGQDGTVVTTQILDLALEDDLGFRVDAEVEVVEANYAEANGDAWFSFTTSIAYFAQGFTMPAGTDRDLASVEVYLQRVGSPTGDVNLYVYDNNATPTPDEPNASVAASTTSVTASSLSASGQVVRLDMDRVSLTAGGSYWVVVEHIDSSGTDYVQIRVDESSPNGSDMTDTATSPEIVSWTVSNATVRQAAGFYVRRFGTQVVPTRQLAPAADKSAKFTWQADGTVALASVTSGGGGGATTLAGLTDTTITAPGAGDFLRYDGSTWLNTTLVAGDIPSLDAAKITTGTFATARIPDLDAAKITSGTFADARIAESNVTQHEAALSVLGIEALSDPNADRIFFWDDSAGTGGAFAFLEVAGGLEIPVAAPTTIQVDAGDGIALSGGEVVFDASVLNDENVAMVAGDRFVIWDSGEAGTGSRQMNPVNIPLSLFNNNLGLGQNVEGAGITLSTTTVTNDTIALDYLGADSFIAEAPAGSIASSDEILFMDVDDASNVKRDLVSSLPFTNNTGDVESVANATNGGLAVTDGGGPDVTLALAVDDLLDHSGTLAAADRFAVWESGAGTRKIAASSIGLNSFNNNLTLTAADIADGQFATVSGTYTFAGAPVLRLGSNTLQPTLQFWDRDTVGGSYRDVITVPAVEELDIGSAGWAVDILGSSVLVNGAAIGTVTSVSNATNGGITVTNGTTTPTLAVDASNLPNFTASTSMEATDRFVVHEAGQTSPTARQIAPADIPLSIFNDNLGFSQNVQGDGISLTTTTGTNDTISVAYAASATNLIGAAQLLVGNAATTDRILVTEGGASAVVRQAQVSQLPFTNNAGTVTSVGGTGTVNGITLSGTVTSSGNLTLGGTFSAPASDITAGTFGAGDYVFPDVLTVQDRLVVTGVGPHGIGTTVSTNIQLLIDGAFTAIGGASASGIRYNSDITGVAGNTVRLTHFDMSSPTITTQSVDETVDDIASFRIVRPTITNNLFNAGLGVAITSATNGTVTTTGAHGFSTSDIVHINGNTDSNHNGWWTIEVTGASTFTLDEYTGTSSGTGGDAYPASKITKAATLWIPNEPTAGTATGIDEAWGIYAPVSARLGNVTAGLIEPIADSTYALGTAINRWSTVYADSLDVGTFLAGDGAESAPSYAFSDDSNTGMWSPVNDTIAFSTGSTERLRVASGAVSSYEAFFVTRPTGNSVMTRFRREDNTDLAWDVRIDTGGTYEIRAVTDAGATVSNGNVFQLEHATGNLTLKGWIRSEDGSNTEPTYSFSNDTDTGMYLRTTGSLGFAVAGATSFRVDGGSVRVSGGEPAYHWYENGEALNEKQWRIVAANGSLYFQGREDDGQTFANPTFMQFVRSGTTVSYVRTYGPWRFADGSAASPAVSFSSDTDTGMYLSSFGTVAFASGGAIKAYVGANEFRVYHKIENADGTAADPAYSFNSDTNTGVYSAAADTIGFSTAGTARWSLNGTGQFVPATSGNYDIGTTSNLVRNIYSNEFRGENGLVSSPSFTFRTDLDTGMYLGSTGILKFSTAGADRLVVSGTSIENYTVGSGYGWQARYVSGTNNPGIFIENSETGNYSRLVQSSSPGNGALYLGVDGINTVILTRTQARFLDGSASAPSITFASDTNTGMYSDAADVLSFATGGSERVYINNTAMYTDALVDTTTRIGQTSHSLVALDAASDFAKPSGYRTMASNASLEKPNGNGTAWTTYYHWNVMSRRDSGGGYNGLALGYQSGRMWYGQNPVDTALPIWYEIWTEATPQALPTANGSASAPFYSFNNDPDTGMYLPVSGSIGFATDSTEVMRVTSSANVLIQRTTETLGGGNGADFQIGAGTGGAGMTIHSSTTGLGDIQFADGTVGDASYRGLIRYDHAADQMQFWAGASVRASVSSAALRSYQPFRGEDGSNALPTYSFVNDIDAGMRLTVASNVRISAATDGTFLDVDAVNSRINTNRYLNISESRNELLVLNQANAAGSPYIAWKQNGTRRMYLQYNNSNAYTYLVNENGGTIELQTSTNEALTVRVSNTTGSPYISLANQDGGKGYLQATDTGVVTLATNVPDAKIYIRDNGRSFNLAEFDYNGTDTVTLTSVSNAVLAINHTSATGNPYLRFKQAGTDKARIQYINGGDLRFRLEGNTDNFSFYAGGATAATDRRLNFNGLGDDLGRWEIENSQFYVEEDQTVLTVAATVTCDWDRSNQLHLTITNTVTIIAIDDDSMFPGGSYILMVQEGTSAPSSVTWDSTDTIFWANGTPPVLNGGDLNDITVVQFFKTTAGSNTRIIGSWFLAQ